MFAVVPCFAHSSVSGHSVDAQVTMTKQWATLTGCGKGQSSTGSYGGSFGGTSYALDPVLSKVQSFANTSDFNRNLLGFSAHRISLGSKRLRSLGQTPPRRSEVKVHSKQSECF